MVPCDLLGQTDRTLQSCRLIIVTFFLQTSFDFLRFFFFILHFIHIVLFRFDKEIKLMMPTVLHIKTFCLVKKICYCIPQAFQEKKREQSAEIERRKRNDDSFICFCGHEKLAIVALMVFIAWMITCVITHSMFLLKNLMRLFFE